MVSGSADVAPSIESYARMLLNFNICESVVIQFNDIAHLPPPSACLSTCQEHITLQSWSYILPVWLDYSFVSPLALVLLFKKGNAHINKSHFRL